MAPDCCLDSLFAWTRQDSVVGVEDIYHVFLVEDTFIDDGLFESDFFEFGAQVLVPDSFCLFLSVHILLDLEDLFTLLCPFHLKPLWDLHVQVSVDWSLSEGEDVVKLGGVPAVTQHQDEQELDYVPTRYWGVCLVVVPLVEHAGAIDVESGLPLVYLPGLDVALALHLPHV